MVFGDDFVRGVEDVGGASVVLGEHDGASARELFVKVEDVADIGAAPSVDRLVIIADDAEVFVDRGEAVDHEELCAVGVLVFVDHDLLEAVGPSVEGVGEGAKDLDGESDQVIKVDGSTNAQGVFVEGVCFFEDHGVWVEGVVVGVDEVVGIEEKVFGLGDRGEKIFGWMEGFVDAVFAHDTAQDGELIAGIVDGEALGIMESREFFAEDLDAEGVEGAEGELFDEGGIFDHGGDAFFHLADGAVGKANGEDAIGGMALGQKMGDAMDDDTGFSAASACKDQQRAVCVQDGVALFGVKVSDRNHGREPPSQKSNLKRGGMMRLRKCSVKGQGGWSWPCV